MTKISSRRIRQPWLPVLTAAPWLALDLRPIRPAFAAARKGGLKITVHCGEIGNDIDTLAVIDFRPERLGHAIVLGEEVRDRLLSMEPRLPIEICPTSNRLVLALDGHGGYPMLGCWIKEGYVWALRGSVKRLHETCWPCPPPPSPPPYVPSFLHTGRIFSNEKEKFCLVTARNFFVELLAKSDCFCPPESVNNSEQKVLAV